jgi:hypothetical protein
VKALAEKDWEWKRFIPDRQGIVFQRAFQPVAEKRAQEWLDALDSSR